MALWVCGGCGALTSVGAPHCPQCGVDDFREEGDANMAKISAAAGPSIRGINDPTIRETEDQDPERDTGQDPDRDADNDGVESEDQRTEREDMDRDDLDQDVERDQRVDVDHVLIDDGPEPVPATVTTASKPRKATRN